MGNPPNVNSGLNGAGAHDDEGPDDDHDDEAPLAEEEVAAPPAEVIELAASCVRFVLSKYKVTLDFTSDTLSLVDQYLRDARAELVVRPEASTLIASAAGAYLGEVVRRRFGGYWRAVGDPSTWRVMLSRVYLSFNPVGMALEALELRDQEGWHAHVALGPGERELIDARLAALPEVSEEEYFAPSTPFDVLEVTVEALRAHMHDGGTGDVRFSPDDYT